ncbi:MAG TPA: hypothetical protein VFB38_17250 [Chthonomonadaceae bacterium]|nr:hypothetical protein [Chthonomonadaceae bacterium]
MEQDGSGRSFLERFPMLRGEGGRCALALLALSLTVRLVPAYLVYGSFDVGAWELVAREWQLGHNPYQTGKLNWPPLWPLLLIYVGRMQTIYGLPSYFAVKLIPICADAALTLALYFWFLSRESAAVGAFKRALWYALNPIPIATCALQGQFESLPALFTTLAVMAGSQTASRKAQVRSALWLALGGLAKFWPLFLLPAFLRQLRPARRQLQYALLAVAPTALSLLLLYLDDPDPILHNVILYRGRHGMWGLTIPASFLPQPTGEWLAQLVLVVLWAAWLVVYFLTWRRGSLAQVACLGVLTFYVFTPGFGLQYLEWVVPLALLADWARFRLFTVLATLNIATVYLFSPFNGEYFDFLRRTHTPLFWATNMNPHHVHMLILIGLPLWLFFIWWWASLLRDIMAGCAA